jgi:hypothetical protein
MAQVATFENCDCLASSAAQQAFDFLYWTNGSLLFVCQGQAGLVSHHGHHSPYIFLLIDELNKKSQRK